MDFKTAFLNGHITQEIYMTILDGMVVPPSGSFEPLVCKLDKSLPGLRQSSRAWYICLYNYLIAHGFSTTKADPNIYVKRDSTHFILIAIYVDDCIILSNTIPAIYSLKHLLSVEFEMSDEGQIHYILGLQIYHDRISQSLVFKQEKYLQSLLVRYHMDKCHDISTPLEVGIKFSKNDYPINDNDKALMADVPYSESCGSLIHSSVCTRLDVTYSVNSLSQYLSNPGSIHWQAMKRVMRYIKGTVTQSLAYKHSSKGHIFYGYSDIDWAGDQDTRRSTSGYCFLLIGAIITWTSKKQTSVALSSTESEYMALSKACIEAVWLRKLLQDLGFPQFEPTTIYVDNQSAIALSLNPKFHSRSKHI
jgi:hypothetical protein